MHLVKRYLVHHWLLKLISFLLATVLWLAIARETASEIGLTVPIEFQNIPSKLEIAGETTSAVEVRLRGPSNIIKAIPAGDIFAVVDLAGMTPADKTFLLSAENIRVPFSVEVVRVSPPRIRLNLEEILTKSVPVIPTIRSVMEGYEVDNLTVTPSKVQVQGPESKIRQLSSIRTAPVEINETKEGMLLVDLDVRDPSVRVQYRAPVELRFKLRKQNIERKVVVPKDSGLDQKRSTIRPSGIGGVLDTSWLRR